MITEQMWEGNELPGGWQAPADYTQALPNFPQTQEDWAAQWKIKLI